jgi:hypothetical protein
VYLRSPRPCCSRKEGLRKEGLRKEGWKEGGTQTGRSKEERKGRKVREGKTGRHKGRKPGTLKGIRKTKNENRTYYPPPPLLPPPIQGLGPRSTHSRGPTHTKTETQH